jgi:hypothetical protein
MRYSARTFRDLLIWMMAYSPLLIYALVFVVCPILVTIWVVGLYRRTKADDRAGG